MRRIARSPVVLATILTLLLAWMPGSAVAADTVGPGRTDSTVGEVKPVDNGTPTLKPCLHLDLSTGTTQPFIVDPFSTTDPDWFVTASPDPNLAVPAPAISIAPVPNVWYTNPAANWVDPWGTGYSRDASGLYHGMDLPGDYVFATTFNLDGTLYNNFVLNMNAYAADNLVRLYLDGNPVGVPAGFGVPYSGAVGAPFTMALGAGNHTLEARVNNGGWWVGLLVAGNVTGNCKPDLTIEKTSHGNFVAGQPGTYMLAVSNIGMGPAIGPIVVNDVLPSGATFVSAAGGGWTCSNAGANVTCTHPGPLPASSSLPPILITITVPQGRVVTNCAMVTNREDANPENNRTCVDTYVNPGRPATICGFKFHDVNGNGVRDPNEQGLANWTIVIKDAFGNIVATTTTDKEGRYCFRGLKPGTYTVFEIQKPNWVQTAPVAPSFYTLSMNSNQVMDTANFGNRAKPDEKCCLTFRFPYGTADNFNANNGVENASPSAGLIKFFGNPAVVGFDYPGVDKMFLSTLTLPQGNCVEAATLSIHVKPNGSSLNSNDAMALRFINGAGNIVPGSPIWGAYFGSGNPGTTLLPNQWDTSNYPSGQWINLNLGSLPGGGNFLPALNSLRYLDVMVQDDTGVDAIVLTVKFCECQGSSSPIDQPTDRPDLPLNQSK